MPCRVPSCSTKGSDNSVPYVNHTINPGSKSELVRACCLTCSALLLQYMVKRMGLDFTEYGLVDARAAKRQRLNGDSNDPE